MVNGMSLYKKKWVGFSVTLRKCYKSYILVSKFDEWNIPRGEILWVVATTRIWMPNEEATQ